MATMISIPKHEGKGRFQKVGALNAYVTGNESSIIAILVVTDAFGLVPPVIRGADLLAESSNALVVVPDYFYGSPGLLSWIDADGKVVEETKHLYDRFVAEKASSPENLPTVIASAADAKLRWPSVNGWGGLGLGWGGKLIAKASGPDTPFKASGQAYPSKPTREDVETFTIPHICLASQTDSPNGVRAYDEILGRDGKGEVETYTSMYHGWMGGRSQLDDPATVKEFERGYKQLARFFVAQL